MLYFSFKIDVFHSLIQNIHIVIRCMKSIKKINNNILFCYIVTETKMDEI